MKRTRSIRTSPRRSCCRRCCFRSVPIPTRLPRWQHPSSNGVWPVAPRRGQGLIAARYAAAGRDYAPSGAPFASPDELGAVLGMTPDLLARLKPHLTVFTDGDPSTATQDVVVAQALAWPGRASPMLTPMSRRSCR